MSIWTFILNLSDLNIQATIKKNYIEIMPTSIPHQKVSFFNNFKAFSTIEPNLVMIMHLFIQFLHLLISWHFIFNYIKSKHSGHNKKNYIEIMPSSIPHQKFCFYHLPTWGRAGIKLGDAWYVSNVSIIFDCSMLLYLLF